MKLARNLLKEDGVILISIDDNEQASLKRICDEIFGDENFVSQIIWQRSKKGDAKLIAKVHEYVLCYAKNKVAVIEAGVWRRKKDGAVEVLAQYAEFKTQYLNDHEKIRSAMQEWFRKLSDSDPRKAHKHYNWSDDRGLYFAADFAGPDDGRASRPRHEIFHPVTTKACKKPSTGWRWDEAKTKWALEQVPPRIHFGVDETTIPNRKSYLEEISVEPYSSVFYRDGRSATLEVESHVGKGVFQFPKNTDVLAELIELVTKPGDLILDFFSGSASTGHAVTSLNAIYGGHRKFILVQIPEACDEKSVALKAGYKTIAEIGKERIRRAGQKIKQDNADKPGIDQLDIGFRVLKVDSSNMNDIYYTLDALKQGDLFNFVDNVREDRTEEDLLFQVLLDWGVDLSLPITRETIAGLSVLFVDGNALAACFDKDGGITEDFVKQLAARQPLRVVFRDAGFANDSVKINIEQIFKLLSPSTEIKTL